MMKRKGPGGLGARDEIRRVLELEARTLRQVALRVDASYAKAVEWLSRCKGKVILTGVGKSGLIAQKIAATFSSTGTPSAYLDCGEALHGGLGFIQRQDLIVALGKSGESEELNDMLPAIRSIGARLIAITANPKSTLARAAGLVLETPIAEEACPLNLAPTSSTTAALAVGDALAVALMQVRNFKAANFALNHPRGRLGRRLTLQVRDIMRGGDSNPVVSIKESVVRMLVEITRLQAGAASIVDSRGRFAGLVTDFDIRRALAAGRDILSLSIRRIMNPDPVTIRPDELAAKAVAIMENRKNPFNVLPVVDRGGRPVGMVQIHDLRARGL
jgi:arabinose-5-phosphate isomerase